MKITVIGAGNVGATCANVIAEKELANEVILIDIKEGFAEGKALDMWQTAPINLYDSRIVGYTNDYSKTTNSEVVVITSGLPRKPGMSRDDLIATNAGIVKSVTENVIAHSPNAIIIVVSNPLDVMTYVSYLTAKVDPRRVFGMAGILDTARYRAFLAEALNVSPKDCIVFEDAPKGVESALNANMRCVVLTTMQETMLVLVKTIPYLH